MAVRIRLTRVGATKQPSYRVVIADSRSARDSRSIETIGHYNPRTEPVELNIDADKAKAWMAKGAKPSDTVARLFRSVGVLPADSGKQYPKAPAKAEKAGSKKAAAKGETAAPAAPAAAAPAPAESAAAETAEPAEPAATEATAEPAPAEAAPAATEAAEAPEAEATEATEETDTAEKEASK